MKVELNTWQYIHDKEKPTFKVDNEQALQLLKGAGLYQSPWQCIREIMQNSADASYIRLWLEKDPLESFSTPNDENLTDKPSRFEFVNEYRARKAERDAAAMEERMKLAKERAKKKGKKK